MPCWRYIFQLRLKNVLYSSWHIFFLFKYILFSAFFTPSLTLDLSPLKKNIFRGIYYTLGVYIIHFDHSPPPIAHFFGAAGLEGRGIAPKDAFLSRFKSFLSRF